MSTIGIASLYIPDFAPLWIALLVSGIFAYPIYRLLLQLKSRQIISQFVQEHQKKQGTPTMGGLITMVGVCVALTVVRDYNALIIAAGFALIGFTDDFILPKLIKGNRGLEWKVKLILQIVVVLVASFARASLPGALALIITLFWILFFSNAYNFSDGMDGLAGSILLSLSAGLGAIAMIGGHGNDGTIPICAALFGGIIPFLFLNVPPAKMFMGDVGALPIGALLGIVVDRLLSVDIHVLAFTDVPAGYTPPPPVFHEFPWQSPLFWPVAIVSLVMIISLVPVPIQIASVKLRKRRIFPMTPIHHAFEKAGWPETRIVGWYALVQIVCSIAGVTLALWGMTWLPT